MKIVENCNCCGENHPTRSGAALKQRKTKTEDDTKK
jgi:hypothetical protein